MGSMPRSLGTRLRELRKAKGLTQSELAGTAYSAAYVSAIEKDLRAPAPAAVGYFAERLGVDPGELSSGVTASMLAELEIDLQQARSSAYGGDYESAESEFFRIRESAAANGVAELEAKALHGAGLVAERTGRPGEALDRYENAARILTESSASTRAEMVAGMARCHQMLGRVRYAIHLLERYLVELEQDALPDPLALMTAYSNLIWPLTEAGLLEDVKQAADEALRLERVVTGDPEVARMHLNVARELFRSGRHDEALRSLTRAEDIFRALNWTAELARAHGNKAIVFAEQSNFEEARRHNLIALELVRRTHNTLTEGRIHNELAKVERLAGELDRAMAHANDALDSLQDVDVGELALAHMELALCFRDASELGAAAEHLKKAIHLYRKADSHLEVANAHRELGDLLCRQGDLDAGREAYRNGLLVLVDLSAA